MAPIQPDDFDGLPRADAIRAGLTDLAAGRESAESLLIQIGAPRLNWLGVSLSKPPDIDADRRLYRLLAAQHGNEAHSQFNSLIRQLVSFERALEGRNSRDLARPAMGDHSDACCYQGQLRRQSR